MLCFEKVYKKVNIFLVNKKKDQQKRLHKVWNYNN